MSVQTVRAAQSGESSAVPSPRQPRFHAGRAALGQDQRPVAGDQSFRAAQDGEVVTLCVDLQERHPAGKRETVDRNAQDGKGSVLGDSRLVVVGESASSNRHSHAHDRWGIGARGVEGGDIGVRGSLRVGRKELECIRYGLNCYHATFRPHGFGHPERVVPDVRPHVDRPLAGAYQFRQHREKRVGRIHKRPFPDLATMPRPAKGLLHGMRDAGGCALDDRVHGGVVGRGERQEDNFSGRATCVPLEKVRVGANLCNRYLLLTCRSSRVGAAELEA